MHRFVILLFLAVGSLLLPACTHKAHPQQTASASSPRKEAGPVLTFERTPCFGTCPGYAMKVYADGRVEYNGSRAVPMMGQRELKMPLATLTNILRQAQEAHFDQFENKYLSGAKDLPSTIIAIRQPSGEMKTVVVEGRAPDSVRDFFAALGNQFDSLAQITITSDK
ncbi:DUF6438 domain-containing protein [Hymenobacter rubidus]|uniref:DUF6438 domain-containing protein n=1 Tax=Hymenobacter rubidus TaxID=1441626 RepID=UPI00191D1D53|nr:DUF6438 domain-containing protein [Hymenobacter rubidus]